MERNEFSPRNYIRLNFSARVIDTVYAVRVAFFSRSYSVLADATDSIVVRNFNALDFCEKLKWEISKKKSHY